MYKVFSILYSIYRYREQEKLEKRVCWKVQDEREAGINKEIIRPVDEKEERMKCATWRE